MELAVASYSQTRHSYAANHSHTRHSYLANYSHTMRTFTFSVMNEISLTLVSVHEENYGCQLGDVMYSMQIENLIAVCYCEKL